MTSPTIAPESLKINHRPEGAKIEKFFTGALKAFTKTNDAGETEYFLRGVASSTVIDRVGDRIAESAQDEMVQEVKGMTIFRNHDYDVPGSVFGFVTDAHLTNSVDAKQGNCVDLVIEIKVWAERGDNLDSWKAINAGVKLGLSIGAAIKDHTYEDDTLVILSVELYEVSLVGIPANQRAMVDVLAKSFRKSLTSAPNSNTTLNDSTEDASALPTVENVDKHIEESAPMEVIKDGRRLSADTVKCLTDAISHLTNAHKCIKDLMEAGDDEQLEPIDGNEGEDAIVASITLDTAVVDVEKFVSETLIEVEDAKVQAEAVIAEKQAELDRLASDLADTKKQLEALKATPAGRITVQTPGSMTMNTADPEFRRKLALGEVSPVWSTKNTNP